MVGLNENIFAKISDFSKKISVLSDEDFKKEAEDLKNIVKSAEKNKDKLVKKELPKAIALLKEATIRAIRMEPFNSQINAGVELFKDNIVEMHPGEGKSLAIHCAAYLKSLSGKKVHIMIENDFLIQRDFHKASKIFKYLGISVGAVVSKGAPEFDLIDKKQAYECDITYVHPVEAGFDYLKSTTLDYVHNADVIVDDIDRIIATQEPTSVVLVNQETKDMDNMLLIDFLKKYKSSSGIADFALRENLFYKKHLKKQVVLIPDNTESKRLILTDNISETKEEKFDKILDEVLEVHKYRCPIIIVVPNEDELEMMTSRLAKKGFNYKLVNGKNILMDAFNISQAGRLNSVTVITKTSGVDVPLGGDAYYYALDQLDSLGLKFGTEEWQKEWKNAYDFCKNVTEQEAIEAERLGGIYEIITEHTYKDDVFKSYCARRGQKGSVKFFISLEDSFFKAFNKNKFFSAINALNYTKEKVLNNKFVAEFIVEFTKCINHQKDRLVK